MYRLIMLCSNDASCPVGRDERSVMEAAKGAALLALEEDAAGSSDPDHPPPPEPPTMSDMLFERADAHMKDAHPDTPSSAFLASFVQWTVQDIPELRPTAEAAAEYAGTLLKTYRAKGV